MTEVIKPDVRLMWASVGDKITPSDSLIQSGWTTNNPPPRQTFNWIDNRQDQMLAHVNQHGIPVWDANTDYLAGKSYVQGSVDGILYRCKLNHIGQQPEFDVSNTYWELAFVADAGLDVSTANGLYLQKANNGSDIPSPAVFRTAIGAAPLSSPAFTDTPTTPTAPLGTATTQIASTAYCVNAVSNYAPSKIGAGASGTWTISVTGNAATATKLATARSITLAGDATSPATNFDGSGNITITTSVPNKANKSVSMTAGNGLTGGGDLSANRTFALGTPSTLTASTLNATSADSHTHAVDFASYFTAGAVISTTGSVSLGPIIMKWVRGVNQSADGFQYLLFDEPFPNGVLNVSVTTYDGGTSTASSHRCWYQVENYTAAGVDVFRQSSSGTATAGTTPFVLAIGY